MGERFSTNVTIVLVRHGRPGRTPNGPISGRALGEWVSSYDDTGITRDLAPPSSLRQLVSSSGCVMASHIRRARESAAWLASEGAVQIDSELREAGLPDSIDLGWPLPPGLWVVIARIGWYLNWCDSAETVEATRKRASRVTERLCAVASERGTLVVVGHGMFNRFVAAELLKRGWRGPKRPPLPYWAAARYERIAGM